MKKKKDENYIDFGQWLYELRKSKGLTEDELVEKINMVNVQKMNIKKWERDLEFPDLDAIYKLSEIYMIPSTEIIDKKQKTLQAGVERNSYLYNQSIKSTYGNINIWNNMAWQNYYLWNFNFSYNMVLFQDITTSIELTL